MKAWNDITKDSAARNTYDRKDKSLAQSGPEPKFTGAGAPVNPFSEGQVVKKDWNRLGNYAQTSGPETGDIIPICNGGNAGNCTEASEVVKHAVRRSV